MKVLFAVRFGTRLYGGLCDGTMDTFGHRLLSQVMSGDTDLDALRACLSKRRDTVLPGDAQACEVMETKEGTVDLEACCRLPALQNKSFGSGFSFSPSVRSKPDIPDLKFILDVQEGVLCVLLKEVPVGLFEVKPRTKDEVQSLVDDALKRMESWWDDEGLHKFGSMFTHTRMLMGLHG